MQLFLLLIYHQVTHSTNTLRHHRGKYSSIYWWTFLLFFDMTQPHFHMTRLLFTLSFFNPSFLIITHLILFLVFLMTNPYPYFKFPYQSHPYVSLFFPFLYFRLMCFVTLLSQHNHIVLALYCVVCSLEKCI